MNTYICHYCINYKTTSISDLNKHFKRKKQCECSSLITYEKAETLSKSKKYIFNFNTDNLTKEDYLYIITHYTNQTNIINYDFRKSFKNKNEDNLLTSNEQTSNEQTSNELTNTFVCDKCNMSFSKKYNLDRHKIKDICEKNKIKKTILEENKEFTSNVISKKIFNNQIQGNFSNCNINQYNNNNLNNHTSYNIQVKDFIHDNYDISHIKNEYYNQKDFFLYHKFLKIIMENEKNHNMFFSNDDAIVFTDDGLIKMSPDKACYLVLDKLSNSFEQLMNIQDEDSKNYYNFINKYYYLLKNQYKIDTIYKDYDVDEKKFIYTAQSNLFRSRDKYLTKIKSSLSDVNAIIRENLKSSISDFSVIPFLNPNIEDFASVRMRYRDLKN